MLEKNIIIFSTAYLPFIGGAEIAVKEITDRLDDANFFMITAKMRRGLPKKERLGNVLVYRAGFGFSFDKFLLPIFGFLIFFHLFKKLKAERRKPILWGIMASYGSIAAYFVKLFWPAIPFLLTLQEGDSEMHLRFGKIGFVGFFGKKIIGKADYIQAISDYLKKFAVSRGAKSPIEIIPNGVNLQRIKNQILKIKITRQKLKDRLNIKPNEKVIVTTSRLVYKNAVDVIIDAVNELQAVNYKLQIKLIIIGDGPLRKELELKAKNRKLKVIFIGSVPPNEIYQYLAMADIFVRPSRSEGLGNSFLEAMAMEVPVIGTAVGGIPDFLRDRETGLFCKVDDPEDLAEKIEILLEDSYFRRRIIENSKKLIEEKYDWNKISERINKIFINYCN
jgi:glycosyltransferase involved in cell wall biosynthesis